MSRILRHRDTAVVEVHPSRHKCHGHARRNRHERGHGGQDCSRRGRRGHAAEDELAGHAAQCVLDDQVNIAAAAPAPEEEQCRLSLDVVVGEGAAVLKLLARKDESLLVGRNALLVLDLLLNVFNNVQGRHTERDRPARAIDEHL